MPFQLECFKAEKVLILIYNFSECASLSNATQEQYPQCLAKLAWMKKGWKWVDNSDHLEKRLLKTTKLLPIRNQKDQFVVLSLAFLRKNELVFEELEKELFEKVLNYLRR